MLKCESFSCNLKKISLEEKKKNNQPRIKSKRVNKVKNNVVCASMPQVNL